MMLCLLYPQLIITGARLILRWRSTTAFTPAYNDSSSDDYQTFVLTVSDSVRTSMSSFYMFNIVRTLLLLQKEVVVFTLQLTLLNDLYAPLMYEVIKPQNIISISLEVVCIEHSFHVDTRKRWTVALF